MYFFLYDRGCNSMYSFSITSLLQYLIYYNHQYIVNDTQLSTKSIGQVHFYDIFIVQSSNNSLMQVIFSTVEILSLWCLQTKTNHYGINPKVRMQNKTTLCHQQYHLLQIPSIQIPSIAMVVLHCCLFNASISHSLSLYLTSSRFV